jgi:hypothetical protein
VYRNIIFSVQPEFSSGYTPPGVRAIGFQKPQPCERFSKFWASLGEDRSSWLRGRAVDVNLETAHNAVQQQVYVRVWQAIIRILSKLDFSFDTDASIDGESADVTADGEENEDGDAPGGRMVVFTQASGMTGQERPRNPRDVATFLNLVDFSSMLLDRVKPEFSKDSCYVFCETAIKLVSRHTLFSGFFKMLTAAMKSAREGRFFRGLSLELVHTHRKSCRAETDHPRQGASAATSTIKSEFKGDCANCGHGVWGHQTGGKDRNGRYVHMDARGQARLLRR